MWSDGVWMHEKEQEAYLDNKSVSYCDELDAALNRPKGGFGAHPGKQDTNKREVDEITTAHKSANLLHNNNRDSAGKQGFQPILPGQPQA